MVPSKSVVPVRLGPARRRWPLAVGTIVAMLGCDGFAEAARRAPLAPPPNDDCTGAITIPSTAFPVLTSPVNVTEATPAGSVNGEGDENILLCTTIESTIWYKFTPTASGQYVFSTCASRAPGNSLNDTVIGVFDSTAGACPQTTEMACNDDGPCAGTARTSQASVVLTAGTTYFVVAGHWAGDAVTATDTIGTGNNTIQIQVDRSPGPSNDTCSSPTPLTLDRIVSGTSAGASNDYRSPAACFTGAGQIITSANGPDVVFSFLPPTTDSYSFRYVQDDSAAALRGRSPVLYLANNCPAPDPTTEISGCLKGANRMDDQLTGNGNRSEEVNCVPLTAGATYYLFFDDAFAASPGGPLAVEVTRCRPESEPNDAPATATRYVPNAGCFMEGATVPSGPGSDVDFYDLGAPPAGSKIFAGVDAAASNTSDYEMRITTATDTLGYDDDDGTSWVGSEAPVVAGPIAPGGEIYARVNGKPASAGQEPYLLFARIETGAPQPESTSTFPDYDPTFLSITNGLVYGATHVTGGFVSGVMAAQDDVDCFRFVAHVGDNLVAFSDNNPTRARGTITNVWPVLHTADGDPPPANTRFSGQVVRNSGMPGPTPGLTGTTPSATSEFMHYRARYTGAYTICFTPTQDDASTENPPAVAYPLPYQGSLSLNCGPIPGPAAADVAIAVAGPAGPVRTGSIVSYTITLTNTDTTGIAQDVDLVDSLPTGVLFLSLTTDDGFSGRNTDCVGVPTPGTNDAAIDCTTYSIAPGARVTYTVTVQVANCLGAGQTLVNPASITSFTTDANAANDSSSWSFTTSEDGTCNVLLCDAGACVVNACKVNDHCVAGACVADDLSCDDHSVCTDDSCDPLWVDSPTDHSPCINDATNRGDRCSDGNDCTYDRCDPVAFCIFPPMPVGTACNDFLNCTNNDVCDGSGVCAGKSVCDDGKPCTDDFADEANLCACTNTVLSQGTACEDGDRCTVGTTCDGLGGEAVHCINPTGTLNCDDNNLCTNDSCAPATGCVHANNTVPCNDGSLCTSGDTCINGLCTGVAVVCNDNNVCTTDSCNIATGCVFTNNTIACSDSNSCTTGDTCGGGTCHPGVVAPNGTACDDGNACTSTDVCTAGVCRGAVNTLGCSDGNDCTDFDRCSNGVCAGTPNNSHCHSGPDPCASSGYCGASGCLYKSANVATAPSFTANRVDGLDVERLARAWNTATTDPLYDPGVDLDGTPGVDAGDFHTLMVAFGRTCVTSGAQP